MGWTSYFAGLLAMLSLAITPTVLGICDPSVLVNGMKCLDKYEAGPKTCPAMKKMLCCVNKYLQVRRREKYVYAIFFISRLPPANVNPCGMARNTAFDVTHLLCDPDGSWLNIAGPEKATTAVHQITTETGATQPSLGARQSGRKQATTSSTRIMKTAEITPKAPLVVPVKQKPTANSTLQAETAANVTRTTDVTTGAALTLDVTTQAGYEADVVTTTGGMSATTTIKSEAAVGKIATSKAAERRNTTEITGDVTSPIKFEEKYHATELNGGSTAATSGSTVVFNSTSAAAMPRYVTDTVQTERSKLDMTTPAKVSRSTAAVMTSAAHALTRTRTLTDRTTSGNEYEQFKATFEAEASEASITASDVTAYAGRTGDVVDAKATASIDTTKAKSGKTTVTRAIGKSGTKFKIPPMTSTMSASIAVRGITTRPGTVEVRDKATYTRWTPGGASVLPPERKRPLYKVTSKLVEPWLRLKPKAPRNTTVKQRHEGFVIDIMDLIGEKAGFDYELHLTRDGFYGHKSKDGRWNGMIGELIAGSADIAASLFTVTTERERVVDFTYSLHKSQAYILMRKSPLNKNAKVNSIKEIIKQDSIKFGTVRDSPIVEELRLLRHQDGTCKAILNKILSNPDGLKESLKEDPDDGIWRARWDDSYAFIVDGMTKDWVLREPPCNLKAVRTGIYKRSHAFAVKNLSPLRDVINSAITDLRLNGKLEALKKKWLGADKCSSAATIRVIRVHVLTLLVASCAFGR